MSDQPGAITNALIAVDELERVDELRQYLAAIVESSHDAILSKSLDGVITSWNHGAELLFGYTAEEMVGRSVTVLIPSDRSDEEPSILARLRRGERIEHYETVRRRKDGSLVDISLTVSPIRDASGLVIGASKIARDITDRRRMAEKQNLILGEMQHRVKNLATVIDVLARQSQPKGDPAVEAFVTRFLGRVQALLSTGELLVTSSSRQADLKQVVENVLRPFVDPDKPSPVTIDGPRLTLGESGAGGLALALHELATNALKYGALQSPSGRVSIAWSIQPEVDKRRVRLEWRESGGPPILAAPERAGFGTRVIRTVFSSGGQGATEIVYAPQGLVCRFEFAAENDA
jgi:two-component system CheB/CheR fusion protein